MMGKIPSSPGSVPGVIALGLLFAILLGSFLCFPFGVNFLIIFAGGLLFSRAVLFHLSGCLDERFLNRFNGRFLVLNGFCFRLFGRSVFFDNLDCGLRNGRFLFLNRFCFRLFGRGVFFDNLDCGLCNGGFPSSLFQRGFLNYLSTNRLDFLGGGLGDLVHLDLDGRTQFAIAQNLYETGIRTNKSGLNEGLLVNDGTFHPRKISNVDDRVLGTEIGIIEAPFRELSVEGHLPTFEAGLGAVAGTLAATPVPTAASLAKAVAAAVTQALGCVGRSTASGDVVSFHG